MQKGILTMTSELTSSYADILLRLLIRPEKSISVNSDVWSNIQWDIFLQLVQKNVLSIRSFEQLTEMDVSVPHKGYLTAVKDEKNRICRTVELIGKISELCTQNGIQFVFTKAFQHYPDMGHDVDLFVSDYSAKADAIIIKSFAAVPDKWSLCHWIAGKSGYETKEYPSPIEIHHGRIGLVGEHNIYPTLLMQNRKKITVNDITTFIPFREDQLIIQVIQRIYGHLHIRLSDVVHTVDLIREDGLGWDYIVRTSKQIGIFGGLRFYLTYINQIYKRLFANDLLSREVQTVVLKNGLVNIRFENWHYRFPVSSVLNKVYMEKFFSEVKYMNWESMWRLSILPPLAVLTILRNLAPRRFGGRKVIGS